MRKRHLKKIDELSQQYNNIINVVLTKTINLLMSCIGGQVKKLVKSCKSGPLHSGQKKGFSSNFAQ